MSNTDDIEDIVSTDHDLLVRIDERTKQLTGTIGTFVTRKEFAPVRAIAYGLVGAIGVGIIGAAIGILMGR